MLTGANLFAQTQYPPHYEEALLQYHKGRYEDSLETIRSVFDNYRTSRELRMLAAANYIHLNNYSSAEAHLTTALRDHPASHEIYAMLASMYRTQGDYNKSVKMVQKAVDGDADNVGYNLEKVRILYLMKKYDDARGVLERILSAHADSSEAVYLDGLIFMRQGRWDNAVFRFRQALKLIRNPGHVNFLADLYNNLGFSQEKSADAMKASGNEKRAKRLYRDAMDSYKNALKINSIHATAVTNRNRIKGKL